MVNGVVTAPRNPMPYELRRYESVAAFANAVVPFLTRDEIANNLQLGLIGRLLESDEREAPLLAAVTTANEVVGVAILASGRHLVLTELPLQALPVVMDAIAGLVVPGVVAPKPLADAVALLGRYPIDFQADRLVWRLDRVASDFRPGHDLSKATEDHVPLLCDWLGDFYREVSEPVPELLLQRVGELVVRGHFFLTFVEGAPVSMAAMVRETPCAGILSYVYTPRAHRGRGFAASCVAAACQVVLAAGKRWCTLNSDQSNVPANAVYRRTGFTPVAELRQVTFA